MCAGYYETEFETEMFPCCLIILTDNFRSAVEWMNMITEVEKKKDLRIMVRFACLFSSTSDDE